jgi:hypothetical protein
MRERAARSAWRASVMRDALREAARYAMSRDERGGVAAKR